MSNKYIQSSNIPAALALSDGRTQHAVNISWSLAACLAVAIGTCAYLSVRPNVLVCSDGGREFGVRCEGAARGYHNARDADVLYLGERFIRALYEWNSSTARESAAEALTLADEIYLPKLQKDLAQARFVSGIEAKGVASRLHIETMAIVAKTGDIVRIQALFKSAHYKLVGSRSKPLSVTELWVEVEVSKKERSVRWPNAGAIRSLREMHANEPKPNEGDNS